MKLPGEYVVIKSQHTGDLFRMAPQYKVPDGFILLSDAHTSEGKLRPELAALKRIKGDR